MRSMRMLSHAHVIVTELAEPLGPVRFVSAEARPEPLAVPWPIAVAVAGMTLAVAAGGWDVSWHNSVGRDRLFTPPHILFWISDLLILIGSGYAILATTFGHSREERGASVRVIGLRAPSGAFILAYASLVMFASAPFDNWYHNAYGMDFGFFTLPHLSAMLGTIIAKVGVMAWIAGVINRSCNPLHGRLTALLLLAGAIGTAELHVVILTPAWSTNMHTAGCYLAIAVFIPSMMIATGWGSGLKWGCTLVGAIYLGIGLAVEWVLPLFPAHPKIGPVYHNVTHLIPAAFPLLLIVPAFVADLVLRSLGQRSSNGSLWFKALCAGPAFMVGALVAQWPFADFLLSPASRNWVFGSAYFASTDPAGVLYDPYKFSDAEPTFATIMVAAFVVSIFTTRLGLGWGTWMRRICR